MWKSKSKVFVLCMLLVGLFVFVSANICAYAASPITVSNPVFEEDVSDASALVLRFEAQVPSSVKDVTFMVATQDNSVAVDDSKVVYANQFAPTADGKYALLIDKAVFLRVLKVSDVAAAEGKTIYLMVGGTGIDTPSVTEMRFKFESRVLYGDVLKDDKVNSKDAILLAQYLAKWDVEINEPAANVLKDDKINSKDAILLAQYLAKWDVTLGK